MSSRTQAFPSLHFIGTSVVLIPKLILIIPKLGLQCNWDCLLVFPCLSATLEPMTVARDIAFFSLT